MNTTVLQQEVLLFTGTSFLRRNWVERENHWYSMVEQLENACWNGMLPELLPEIIADSGAMFVWQVQQCNAFLHVELGAHPYSPDPVFSIDPHMFIQFQADN
jgi:hypothetical protein